MEPYEKNKNLPNKKESINKVIDYMNTNNLDIIKGKTSIFIFPGYKLMICDQLITNFHFPPNLRVKFSKTNKKNLNRKHPTEAMHADTWTGANPNWLAVHLFILGDIKKKSY